jgi:hypothetical protein
MRTEKFPEIARLTMSEVRHAINLANLNMPALKDQAKADLQERLDALHEHHTYLQNGGAPADEQKEAKPRKKRAPKAKTPDAAADEAAKLGYNDGFK